MGLEYCNGPSQMRRHASCCLVVSRIDSDRGRREGHIRLRASPAVVHQAGSQRRRCTTQRRFKQVVNKGRCTRFHSLTMSYQPHTTIYQYLSPLTSTHHPPSPSCPCRHHRLPPVACADSSSQRQSSPRPQKDHPYGPARTAQDHFSARQSLSP